LGELDAETAKSLGFYDDAQRLNAERQEVEAELAKCREVLPTLPGADTLRERARAAFDGLETVLNNATIEEKRELIGLYVKTIKADPDAQRVQISLYPALFNKMVAGWTAS